MNKNYYILHKNQYIIIFIFKFLLCTLTHTLIFSIICYGLHVNIDFYTNTLMLLGEQILRTCLIRTYKMSQFEKCFLLCMKLRFQKTLEFFIFYYLNLKNWKKYTHT